MKKRNWVLLVVLLVLLVPVGYVLNGIFGNPVAKSEAEKEVLAYFEEKYQKDFTIYSARYNYLSEDYNIKMGPSDEPQVVFDTSKQGLEMHDDYGAYLASVELKKQIVAILAKTFPELSFRVKVEEEHHIEVAGVEFDWFATDPQIRLEKNYFASHIGWDHKGETEVEVIQVMDTIAKAVHEELKGVPKQLTMTMGQEKKNQPFVERFYVNGNAIIKEK